MKLSCSSEFQAPFNVKFNDRREVKNLDDLVSVARYDHTEAKLKGTLKTDNFISTDCLIMDVDNDGVKVEETLEPELLREKFFHGVEFYIIYSRNHNRDKNGISARPRYHVYFPLSEKITSTEQSRRLKEILCSYCPYFDKGAKDATRKIFGVDNPHGIYFDGEIRIDEFIKAKSADEELKSTRRKMSHVEDFDEKVTAEKKSHEKPKQKKEPSRKIIDFPDEVQFENFEVMKEKLKEALPYKPYCANKLELAKGRGKDKDKDKIKILPREYALKAKYIQLNPPNIIKFLVFKVPVSIFKIRFPGDLMPDFNEELGGLNMLCPFCSAESQRGKFAYLVYVLSTPVYTGAIEHSKPREFLDAVIAAYTKILGAKACIYAGIMPNFFNNQAWVIREGVFRECSLKFLTNWIDLPPKARKIQNAARNRENHERDRNWNIFEDVRLWAYKERRNYWGATHEAWFNAVLEKCRAVKNNYNFPDKGGMLKDNEIRVIARHIADWTEKHITPEGLSNFARACVNRRWLSEKENGISLLKQGWSVNDISELLGVNYTTVYRWKKEAGLKRENLTEQGEWTREGISRATCYRRKKQKYNF